MGKKSVLVRRGSGVHGSGVRGRVIGVRRVSGLCQTMNRAVRALDGVGTFHGIFPLRCAPVSAGISVRRGLQDERIIQRLKSDPTLFQERPDAESAETH